MKQERFGSKVQNWHRPLWPDELKHSYRRDKVSWDIVEEAYDSSKLPVRLPTEEIACDCSWNSSEPCCEHLYHHNYRFHRYLYDNEPDEYELPPYYLRQLVLELSGNPEPWLPVSDAELRTVDCASDLKELPRWSEPIEQRLKIFIDLIRQLPNSQDELRRIYLSSPFQPDLLNRFSDAQSLSQSHDCFFALRVFAPFWLRDPSKLKRGSSFTEICKWLFRKVPAPDFAFSQVWWFEFDEPSFKWMAWAIILGFGGSLKRAATLFDWKIRGKFQACLSHYDHDSHSHLHGGTMHTGITSFAEIMRLGGGETELRRLATCRELLYDPTGDLRDPVNEYSFPEFWESTVRWLIRHRNELTDADCGTILFWAYHEHMELEMHGRGQPPFSLQQRTPASALRSAREYENRILNLDQPAELNQSWAGHNWDWEPVLEGQQWSFVELTSSTALSDEGRLHNHCVGGYAWQCVTNRSAIVSLRSDGVPAVTIQVDVRTGRIVQARGYRNREASRIERQVIGVWLREIVEPTHVTPNSSC